MRKLTRELSDKTVEQLEEEILALREEIARLRLSARPSPQKDINILVKKRKRLAVALTVLGQKKEREETNT